MKCEIVSFIFHDILHEHDRSNLATASSKRFGVAPQYPFSDRANAAAEFFLQISSPRKLSLLRE